MGYCTNPPALVLAFMEEGSLFDRLHREVICYVNYYSTVCHDAHGTYGLYMHIHFTEKNTFNLVSAVQGG